jgi:hypothetical protein
MTIHEFPPRGSARSTDMLIELWKQAEDNTVTACEALHVVEQELQQTALAMRRQGRRLCIGMAVCFWAGAAIGWWLS